MCDDTPSFCYLSRTEKDPISESMAIKKEMEPFEIKKKQ
jgi:hypothetical protein